MQNIQLQRTFW